MESRHYDVQPHYSRVFHPKEADIFHFSAFEQPSKVLPDFKFGHGTSWAPSNSQLSLNAGASRLNSFDWGNTVTPAQVNLHSSEHASLEVDAKKHNSPKVGHQDIQCEPHMLNNRSWTERTNDLDTDGKTTGQSDRSMGIATNTDVIATTRTGDSKTLRRLAQNREAARKSRLRKKAYVQQLESSRIKLSQLEHELQRARQQGFNLGGCNNDPGQIINGGNNINGALNPGAVFDMEYAHWIEEHDRQMVELRAALQTHAADNELRVLVETMISHYDEIFRLKGSAAKQDVFHLVSGMWKSPAERVFLWMGGFRPSELLKIMIPHLDPVTDQQLGGIYNLQQSSQQAEDALSQGMEALQQTLAETLTSGSLSSSSNVSSYMGQMAMAMEKLGTLERFVRQADNLRQQTLQQMYRILTTRQSARGLLALGEYCGRLRALSSLWSARPRE